MSAFLWMCQRCGNVGFHSEACITATAAAEAAFRDDYLRESLSARERARIEAAAVEAERRRLRAAVRAINPGGPTHKADVQGSSFDPLLRETEVLALLSEPS